MDSLKVTLFIIGLALLQMVLLPLLVPTDHLVNTFNKERKHVANWFGYDRTMEMIVDADENFEALFINTGIASELTEWLTHDPNIDYKNDGMNEVSQHPFFEVISEKLQNVWLMAKGGLLRVEMIFISILLSLSFLIPSVIDGLVIRERLRGSTDNVSTIFYHQSQKIFTGCLLLPLLAVFWPIAMSPIYFVVWTFFLAGSVWLMCKNLQLNV